MTEAADQGWVQIGDGCSMDGAPWPGRRYIITKHMCLWFQLEDTVLLIGKLLLFDPVIFSIYEASPLIGSIVNFESLLGAPRIKNIDCYFFNALRHDY